MRHIKWSSVSFRRLLRKAGGVLLFVVGIAALVLPLMPGWPLIGLGLYLLSVDSPEAHARIGVLRVRYRILDRMLLLVDRFIGQKPVTEKKQEDAEIGK